MERTVGNESVVAAMASTARPTDLGADGEPPEVAADGRRFVPIRLLARGGLGEVSEAFDVDLRRRVAIKAPRADRPAATHLLIREAQVTAQLGHPNVPAVHAFGIGEDQRPFFAMTWVRGKTLTALAESERLSVQRKLRIFVQAAYAVAAAHERGVLHRDLKPDNVMVGMFGEVRVMDWGIAKVGRGVEHEPSVQVSQTSDTHAGDFLGTPGYAAPEQVEGADDIDRRADVFSLGAVLYELLWGTRLVPGRSSVEVLAATTAGDTVPIEPTAELSATLVAIVRKATARDREQRYASVDDLIRDVEAFMDGEPVSAVARSPLTRAGWLYRVRADRIHRFRPIDVDLIVAGHVAVGAGAGMAAAHAFTLPLLWAAIIVALGGIAVTIPAYTLLRRPRGDEDRKSTTVREGARRTDT